MKSKYLISAVLLMSPVSVMAKHHHQQENSEWQTIPIASEMEIVDGNGQPKTITPSCAFDTVPNPLDGTPLDNSFRFYFKEGKSKNVLVFFNGGGSCWNDATCVASLALANVPDDRPTYNPSVLQENSPVDAGGVFDDDNRRNPFKDWSKVFIPYCTGDLHAGSSEVAYTDVDGSITGFPGAPVTVKHKGFDNFLAVQEWMKNRFKEKRRHRKAIDKMLITGSSAGGYGATLNFPYLQDAFPRVKISLLADASASIVSEGFVNDVFRSGSPWNFENTLPSIFRSGLGTYTAADLNVDLFQRLSYRYPRNRFAQYTTEFDGVQVLFNKVMDQIDQGNNNPFTWALQPSDYLYFAEWNARMTASFEQLADTTRNYQYYIGQGSIHTIMTDDFATDEVPHPFYDERSARGIRFTTWLNYFVNSRWFYPISLAYQGD
ncbi:MAG: hypothetical protein CL579_00260 [Alteromonadaceae bacterium]|nr:hypothetical protein [Alteromonadaceae bacterium]MBB17908.1 hypothetical protein [Rickettsiales bacterium]